MPSQYSTVLAIETATSACSVALLADGKRYEQCEVGNNIHSQVLLSMVDLLLQQAKLKPADLQLVVVGHGPGSFTGLRIGIGVAQGLAFGADCPMLGISSLEALASQAGQDGQIVAGLDARMGEIYWASYQKKGGELQAHSALQVTSPEQIKIETKEVALVGNAWGEYWQKMDADLRAHATHLKEVIYPSATALLDLALQKIAQDGCADLLNEPVDFAPIYVRDNVAVKSTG